MSSLYDVLGVTPHASDHVIRAAYRARLRDVHPDAGGDHQQAALVNEAFEVLSNPESRRAYDATLQQDDTTPSAGPEPTAPASAPAAPDPYLLPVDAPDPELLRNQLWVFSMNRRTTRILRFAVFLLPVVGAVLMVAAQPTLPTVGVAGACLTVAFVWWATHKVIFRVIVALGTMIAGATLVPGGPTNYVVVAAILAALMSRFFSDLWHMGGQARNVMELHEAADRLGLPIWFVDAARNSIDSDRTFATLTSGGDRIDVELEGRHYAGSFIVCDMSQTPARPIATASSLDVEMLSDYKGAYSKLARLVRRR